MAAKPQMFRRAVLGLQAKAPDRALQAAAKMADLLQLELLGLFIEDKNLQTLASIPFSREYHTLSGAWQPLDPDRLARDIELVARGTERALAETAKRFGITSRFEVIRGSAAASIASVSDSDDVVIIVEPESPAERSTQQYSWLVDAAFGSSAAVMLMPSRAARSAGPVVALAASPDDGSVSAGAAFAGATNEDLIIVEQYQGASSDQALTACSGLNVRRLILGRGIIPDASSLSVALGTVREQLVVVSPGMIERKAVAGIVAVRRVPVLVTGPSAVVPPPGSHHG